MFDAYRFINSKDVADHLRDAGYEFTAAQAAFLVHKCQRATLAEKLAAWRTIAAEMPDCEVPTAHGRAMSSAHKLIAEHAELQEGKFARFLDGEGGLYFPYKSRWSERPRWLPDSWVEENGLWNRLAMPAPCSTFEKCVERLQRENGLLVDGWRTPPIKPPNPAYDRHVVCRVGVDEWSYDCYEVGNSDEPMNRPRDFAVLDADFEITDVSERWNDMAIDNVLPAIPAPFEPGDIVIDRMSRRPRPFVFLYHVPWAGEGGGAHFDRDRLWALLGERQGNDFHKAVARNFTEFRAWQTSAFGYEVDPRTGTLLFDEYGASANYLDLERYGGPLDGELALLRVARELVRGETSVDHVVNFSRLLSLDDQSRRLRRDFGRRYWRCEMSSLGESAPDVSRETVRDN